MVKAGWGASIALAGLTIFMAGCTGSRIGALNTQPAPAPLPASPSGTVTGQPLPAPTQPAAATPAPTQFPEAPEPATPAVETPTVEAPKAPEPAVQEVAARGPVTREALVGAWTVSTAGSSCQMFMALTQWTGGYRAASRGCPGDAANVSAWDVKGQQVVLADSSGNTVATLFASGGNRYDGQTKSGRAISLSR